MVSFLAWIDAEQAFDNLSAIAHVMDGTAAFTILFLSAYIGVIPTPFGVGFIPAPALTGLFLAGANLMVQILFKGGESDSTIMGGFVIDLLAVGFAIFCGSLKGAVLSWLVGVLVLFLLLYFVGIPGAFERCADVCPFVFLEPHWRDIQRQVGL